MRVLVCRAGELARLLALDALARMARVGQNLGDNTRRKPAAVWLRSGASTMLRLHEEEDATVRCGLSLLGLAWRKSPATMPML